MPALLLLASASVHAANLTATWNANPESDIAGYRILYGTTSGTYTTTVDVGNVTSTVVSVAAGQTYFFVLQAYDTMGLTSPNSTEVSVAVPAGTGPTLSNLSPSSGVVGAPVTITGTNFGATQSTSTVKFNGTTATPTSWSATSITVPAPIGATTGNVVVTVGGVASNALTFTVTLPAPTLTSLLPTSGPVGTSVTVTGTNFGSTKGTSTITFNGTTATPTSWSNTSIVVPVPSGATSGNVVVTVGGLASNGVSFTVTVAPSITTLSPTSGPVGTSVTVTGTNFGSTKGTSTITFNGTTATPTSWSNTSIVVPVPSGATTGNVVVTVGGLASSGVTFTVTVPPSITTLSPTSGPVATSVTVTGTNFGATKGTSTIKFNGTTATPTSWSNSSIVVPVPSGATTGSVVVTVGSLASNGVSFTVIATPSITSLSPTSGPVATSVTITGTNFGATQGSSTVKFNGTTATPTSWSNTSIVAPVPSGATTGSVVVTVNSVASNGVSFSVTPPPSITSLSPTSGPVATSVTITGTNFGATKGTSTVKFNGTTATPTSWANTSIVVPVPSGATTGNVVVTVNSAASSGVTFTVVVPTVTLGPSTVAPSGNVTVSWSGIGSPTAKDFVVVAPVGAADTAWVAWGYTNGASSGSLTLTLTSYITPGTYNARLFPNDTWQRLAVSNTISVLSPTVAASPSSLTPGGTLTVSWQNIGAPTTQDWLTLNPVGAADANWLAWIYGTGRANDSALFPIPSNLPAGSYEVRLFSNGTFNRLAVSNTVTVTAPGPGLAASPALVAPNGTMTVSWQNIASPTPNDWIGVFPVGSSDTSYSARISTGGRASDRALIQLPGGLAAGSWELRLYSNNTFTRLASSNTFTVGQPGISVNKASVEPGGTVTVTWSGLPSPTPKDWYALIPQNGLDSNWYVWSYTTGTASGSGSLTIPATVPMGTYELRLYANDGFQRLAVSNLVTVQPTVTVSPTPVAAGGTVTITWAGISAPTPKDWFTLNPLNNNDHAWLAYVYGDGRSSDSLTFTLPSSLPAGLYDMRLYSNDSWTRLSLSNIITVTAPGPTLSAGPVGVASGTSVTVSWSGIPAPSVNNWIGLYAVGAPNANFLKQVFTNGQAAGSTSFTAPSLPAGAYELRLFADSSFTRLAVSNGITALAGAAVQASPTTVAKGSTITIAWQGIANPAALDFVTLNQQGAADQTYIATAVTGGVASGTLTLTMPAGAASGNYDIRLFSNNTWTRLGASNVIVVP